MNDPVHRIIWQNIAQAKKKRRVLMRIERNTAKDSDRSWVNNAAPHKCIAVSTLWPPSELYQA